MRILVTGGSGFIGTNLIDILLDRQVQVLNLDINSPKRTSHLPYWQQCDILNLDLTRSKFEIFMPTHIIHLAARTDTLSDNLDDYRVNTEGTANILNCILQTPSVERAIITSSQFAFGPPGVPESDEEYRPIGAYGASKVISEKATRTVGLRCCWTITRPTNIWGPWHPRYPHEFWLVLRKRLYIHPGGRSAIRSYGYVKNIVYQMMRILESPRALVDKKVYYLGDNPIPLSEWANGFSLAITGRKARVMPRLLLKVLAGFGSILDGVGVRFPITLSRFRSMTEDFTTPMAATINDFGLPPYSLEQGINETVRWLEQYWNGKAN